MNEGVPSTMPNIESLLCELLSKTRATPKSSSFTDPSLQTKTFCGLRSRWMIPACVNGMKDVHQLVGDVEDLDERDLPAALLPESLEGHALEEVHHEEDAAVVGYAVVEHADDPGVLHRVREVPLPEEALADRRDRRRGWDAGS